MLKIYRIVDNTNGNIYIGKTTQTLKKRLSNHKYDKDCVSRDIIKNGDYRMELIEITEDESRERYYIENIDCINHNIPGRTQKEYYEKHNNKILQKKKEYYQNNREEILQNKKEYREKNRDKRKAYDKIRDNWRSSMGGNPYSDNNSLLKIDPNLFF